MGKRSEETLEDIRVANMYMKRCSTLSVIREIQIKISMRHHFTPTRMAVIDKIVRACKGVEMLEASHIAGGNVKRCHHLGRWPHSYS